MPIEDSNKQSKAELRLAERLYSEQRFADLVKHLAPQIFLFRNDARYYELLGIASLYTGDFSGAHSYLLRGRDLDPLNLDLQFGLAITHLSRKDEPQALRLLVDIQDKHPADQRVETLLAMLREAPENLDWQNELRLGKLRPLYPGPGFNWRRLLRRLGAVGAGVAAATVVALLVAGLVRVVITQQALHKAASVQTAKPAQPGGTGGVTTAGTPALDDRAFGVPPGGAPRYRFSPIELEAIMNEATQAFREYRDNRARVLVNRVMQSDAPARTKEQARGLGQHLKEPSFVTFRDNFDPDQVQADPLAYSGAHVMWRGKVADLKKGQTAILFSFLIGYDRAPVVQGIATVELGFATAIENDQAIELIAEVVPDFSGGYRLKGKAIRLIRSE